MEYTLRVERLEAPYDDIVSLNPYSNGIYS